MAIAVWVATLRNRIEPHFAQASSTPAVPTLRVEHPDDTETWQMLYARGYMFRPETFSRSRGGAEPTLKLSDVLGSRGPKVVAAIERSGQIMFHAVGSTGDVTDNITGLPECMLAPNGSWWTAMITAPLKDSLLIRVNAASRNLS